MELNIEVLQYIYQNSQMGVISIDAIVRRCSHKKFCDLLKMQKDEYTYISLQAQKIIKNLNYKLEKIGLFTRLMTNMTINVNINNETSVSKITRMLLKGTNMGILDITDKLNNYKITDRKIKSLAKTLKQTLENNLEELKKFI